MIILLFLVTPDEVNACCKMFFGTAYGFIYLFLVWHFRATDRKIDPLLTPLQEK